MHPQVEFVLSCTDVIHSFWIPALGGCARLGVAMNLSAHGAAADELPVFATEAFAIKRLIDNNPRELTLADIEAIYRAAH